MCRNRKNTLATATECELVRVNVLYATHSQIRPTVSPIHLIRRVFMRLIGSTIKVLKTLPHSARET